MEKLPTNNTNEEPSSDESKKIEVEAYRARTEDEQKRMEELNDFDKKTLENQVEDLESSKNESEESGDVEEINENEKESAENNNESIEEENKAEKETLENPEDEPEKKKNSVELSVEQESIIEDKFKKFNLSENDLESMEGYSELSFGKRLLLIENLNQLTLGRIQEEAIDAHNDDMGKSGLLGRIWKKASAVYQVRKFEKKSAKDIEKGGIETHKDSLNMLLKLAGKGPDVEVSEDGKLEIQYAGMIEGISDPEKDMLKDFNGIATEFSKIPEEWSYETADKKHQEEYKEALDKYNKAKTNLMYLKAQHSSDNVALAYIAGIDGKVKANQFLNTHKDVEDQLYDITNKNAWSSALANVVTERGLYAGAGYLTRAATVSVLGAFGAPIAASFMGGVMAARRTKKSLAKKEVSLRESGVSEEKRKDWARRIKDAKSEKEKELIMNERYLDGQNVIDSSVLRQKLIDSAKKINQTDEEIWEGLEGGLDATDISEEDKMVLINKEKERRLNSFKARTAYTERKMLDGMVSYGEKKDSLSNRYDLGESLSNAVSFVSMEGVTGDDNLEKRLDSFLDFRSIKIDDAKRSHLKKEVMKGAALGGSFAVLGYMVREASEWFGSDNVVENKNSVENNNKVDSSNYLEKTNAQIVEEIDKEPFNNLTVEDKSVKELIDDAAALAEIKETPDLAALIHEVKSGDNIWNIVEENLNNSGALDGLEEGRKTYIIDSIKDRFAKMSPDELKDVIGISSGNIDKLTIGDEIDLSSVLSGETGSENIENAVKEAANLKDESIANIEANNAKISEWHKNNPDVFLSSEKVEEILSGSSGIDAGGAEIIEPSVEAEGADVSLGKEIRDSVLNGRALDLVGKYNKDLFDGVESEVQANGDTIISFTTEDNALDVKMIITKDGKVAVDGYGKRNWPDGAKLGWGPFARNEDTFASLESGAFKDAMNFINNGGAVSNEANELFKDYVVEDSIAPKDLPVVDESLELVTEFKKTLFDGGVKDVIGNYNEALFDNIEAETKENGDTVLSFGVRANADDVKIIITKDGKIAVDGFGKNNWPDGVDIGLGSFGRDETTFKDFSDENLKEALSFINNGNAVTESDLEAAKKYGLENNYSFEEDSSAGNSAPEESPATNPAESIPADMVIDDNIKIDEPEDVQEGASEKITPVESTPADALFEEESANQEKVEAETNPNTETKKEVVESIFEKTEEVPIQDKIDGIMNGTYSGEDGGFNGYTDEEVDELLAKSGSNGYTDEEVDALLKDRKNNLPEIDSEAISSPEGSINISTDKLNNATVKFEYDSEGNPIKLTEVSGDLIAFKGLERIDLRQLQENLANSGKMGFEKFAREELAREGRSLEIYIEAYKELKNNGELGEAGLVLNKIKEKIEFLNDGKYGGSGIVKLEELKDIIK